MELLRPIPHPFPKNTLFFNIFQQCDVPSIYSHVMFKKSLEILGAVPDNEILSSPALPIDIKYGTKYFDLQDQINACINTAETVNVKLRMFLQKTSQNQAEKNALFRKDFMTLRNIFSEYVKNCKSLKQFDLFNSKEKLSKVTSTFHKFITDRNIYTHGRLQLFLQDEKFLLEYIENSQLTHCEVTTDILLSFNNIYQKLILFINLMTHLLNQNPDKEFIESFTINWHKY